MAKPKRIKAAAAVYVPQSRENVIADIRKIGDLQRDAIRLETEMNDRIGAITQECAPRIEGLKKELETLSNGVQAWCEANRDDLTNKGKTKTANLITGDVCWRTRPPSVTIRGVESVLETLKRLKLTRFIRTKEEVNKDAILNERNAVAGVAGISVKSGVEDFAIIPFEQSADI